MHKRERLVSDINPKLLTDIAMQHKKKMRLLDKIQGVLYVLAIACCCYILYLL